MDVDLNSVPLLVRVAGAGSFSAAARSLRMPISSVSRRVAALEAALGVTLLARTTRSLRLTEAGRVYVERAALALEELNVIQEDVRRLQSKPQGRVRLTAPVAMGADLSALAVRFLTRHPDIALDIDLSDERRDLQAKGIDIALRAGKPEPSELVARKLCNSNLHLFASPSYLRRAPRLRDFDDLPQHRLLASSTIEGTTTWKLWRGRKPLRHRFEPALVINEMLALKCAVAEGLGLALMPMHPCAPALGRGELVHALPELRGPESALWLQFAKRAQLSAAAAVVVDHLLAVLPKLLDERSL
jgi:DNA-binding transcriptional LysR family regulator